MFTFVIYPDFLTDPEDPIGTALLGQSERPTGCTAWQCFGRVATHCTTPPDLFVGNLLNGLVSWDPSILGSSLEGFPDRPPMLEITVVTLEQTTHARRGWMARFFLNLPQYQSSELISEKLFNKFHLKWRPSRGLFVARLYFRVR